MIHLFIYITMSHCGKLIIVDVTDLFVTIGDTVSRLVRGSAIRGLSFVLCLLSTPVQQRPQHAIFYTIVVCVARYSRHDYYIFFSVFTF